MSYVNVLQKVIVVGHVLELVVQLLLHHFLFLSLENYFLQFVIHFVLVLQVLLGALQWADSVLVHHGILQLELFVLENFSTDGVILIQLKST